MKASYRNLKMLAGTVWYAGSAVLCLKGAELLYAAEKLRAGEIWPWLALATGLLLGSVKARFIFHKFCRKNLARIEGLSQPRIWQIFRPRFFLLLVLMIMLGMMLSRLARDVYPALIGVAVLDFSIAMALLFSSRPFWQGRPSGS